MYLLAKLGNISAGIIALPENAKRSQVEVKNAFERSGSGKTYRISKNDIISETACLYAMREMVDVPGQSTGVSGYLSIAGRSAGLLQGEWSR